MPLRTVFRLLALYAICISQPHPRLTGKHAAVVALPSADISSKFLLLIILSGLVDADDVTTVYARFALLERSRSTGRK